MSSTNTAIEEKQTLNNINSNHSSNKPIPPISYETNEEICMNSSEYELIQQSLLLQGEVEKPFWVKKFHQESNKNWDKFYKRNENRFFKDRHYLSNEFPDLQSSLKQEQEENQNKNNENNLNEKKRKTLFEIGCGVGNALFPLIEEYPNMNYLACDCSKNAIELLKEHPVYTERNKNNENKENNEDKPFLTAWTHDIVNQPFPSDIGVISSGSVDYCTLIFVLSALAPQDHLTVFKRIYDIQKNVSGLLFIRDYGLYDSAQLRFGKGSKLADNFYHRQDGTRSYFFSLSELRQLAESVGYEVIQCVYCRKEVQNRKDNITMRRNFIQLKARAKKPD